MNLAWNQQPVVFCFTIAPDYRLEQETNKQNNNLFNVQACLHAGTYTAQSHTTCNLYKGKYITQFTGARQGYRSCCPPDVHCPLVQCPAGEGPQFTSRDGKRQS